MNNIKLNVDISVDFGPCLILSATGLVSNVLNVITFWKIGFRESSTVSLMVISVNDCVKCCLALFHRGYGLAGLFDEVIEINWNRTFVFINGQIQAFGSLLVNVTIMYLTVERSLCLCFPLKVRSLVTFRVTVVALGSLIGLVLASQLPTFCTYVLAWSFDPRFHTSLIQFASSDVFAPASEMLFYHTASYLFWGFCPFAVTIVGTVVIIVKLKQHGEFRSTYLKCSELISERTSNPIALTASKTAHSNPTNIKQYQPTKMLSRKETRLVRMLLVIAVLYFVQILPRLTIALSTTIEPQFYFTGKLGDIFEMCFTTAFIIDYVVANLHLFVYLFMSTQFRNVFYMTINIKRYQ